MQLNWRLIDQNQTHVSHGPQVGNISADDIYVQMIFINFTKYFFEHCHRWYGVIINGVVIDGRHQVPDFVVLFFTLIVLSNVVTLLPSCRWHFHLNFQYKASKHQWTFWRNEYQSIKQLPPQYIRYGDPFRNETTQDIYIRTYKLCIYNIYIYL